MCTHWFLLKQPYAIAPNNMQAAITEVTLMIMMSVDVKLLSLSIKPSSSVTVSFPSLLPLPPLPDTAIQVPFSH